MTAVSPAVRDLLQRLAFRESMGTCYLVQGGYGREVLVVPELRVNGPLARSQAYNRATIRAASQAGYVSITEGNSEELRFNYRQRLDGRMGDPIALTAAGREAIATKAVAS